MEIDYITSDKSIHIKLIYLVKNQLKYYHTGKNYPKHTQCLLFVNGLFENCGTVIKHEQDKDNQIYAYKMATKKALSTFNLKFIRKEVWKLVLKELNK